jgi:hypothetical protein
MKLKPNATHLKITSADNFDEFVDLDTINKDERVMLTYAWDGVPLLMEHGFPLRMYIPDVYGMKQPKWIEAIDVIDRWEPGYWIVRGWDREGRMKATAVIDAVETGTSAPDVSGRRLASVGGIAHAGARRISRVEMRVDDGEWRDARLRDPLSETTWVIWRADLPAETGDHMVTVRSYDGNGQSQPGPFRWADPALNRQCHQPPAGRGIPAPGLTGSARLALHPRRAGVRHGAEQVLRR